MGVCGRVCGVRGVRGVRVCACRCNLDRSAGQKDPVLNFRSLTGKAKNSAGDIVTVAGDQLLCRDITKTALKSPFERDVVQNLESTETLLDYTLAQLGINTERLQHPVLMTEGVCTPNYARGRMSEVLFECYGAPKVAYATDALLAYEYNTYSAELAAASALTAPWKGAAAAGLIVRVGNSCAHVIPVVNGAAALEAAYRLNAGGQRISDTLSDLLRNRYPQHRPAITASRVSFLKEHHCHVPPDYTQAAQAMAREVEASDPARGDPDAPLSFITRLQLPYTDKEVPKQTAEDVERRNKLRQEQTLRLTEMARVKREEKLRALSSTLTSLLELQEQLKGLKVCVHVHTYLHLYVYTHDICVYIRMKLLEHQKPRTVCQHNPGK